MLVKFNYLSEALMMQTNVTMILPSWTAFDEANGKAESYLPGTKFQTLYLLHGGTGDDSDYVNFSNIVRYADEHKIAVIMPAGYNSGYVDEPDDVLPWPRRYWTFVFEELPKVCEAMFPISSKREDTFVAGLSMGAIGTTRWAIYGADRVAAALMMSGGGMDPAAIMSAVDHDNNGETDFTIDMEHLESLGIKLADEESDLFKTAKKNVEEGKPLPKIFMTCGGDDFIRPFVYATRDVLTKYGYDVTYEEVPGYKHEWDFWDLSLRKALNEWFPIHHDVLLKDD
jgi:S-formylglutathione hydrolase FrmB